MKAMVGLVIAILVIFGYKLFWPSSELDIDVASKKETVEEIQIEQEKTTDEVISSSQKLNAPSDESKRKLMEAEYELLEQARKKLKRHIALLKHKMWGLKFSPDVAKKLSNTVLSANRLLKNPHMLGAFSSVEQIKDETAKIEFADKSLVEIEEIVEAKIEENANAVNLD